jgi:hypothetical protein
MAPIVESIEISCRPEDVFAYATDFRTSPNGRAASCRHAPRKRRPWPWDRKLW